MMPDDLCNALRTPEAFPGKEHIMWFFCSGMFFLELSRIFR
jgi:hypothetical protein